MDAGAGGMEMVSYTEAMGSIAEELGVDLLCCVSF